MFTIIITHRNRELSRLRRCLESFKAQTFQDFAIIIVDYGNDTQIAQQLKTLVKDYDFTRYIYSDTRGHPWNSAHALNIGIRQVETPFVITIDIDMIFPPNFLEIVAPYADKKRALYCAPYFLPENFTDWEHPEQYLDQLPLGDNKQVGGFQCVATEVLHELGGFDEYYRYWGLEDIDLKERLEGYGLEITWLGDQVFFFHQWHPPASINKQGFVPHSFWIHAVLHRSLNADELIRNNQNWGRLIRTEDRPIFEYMDAATQMVRDNVDLNLFDMGSRGLLPSHQETLGRFMGQFNRAPSGSVILVPHADFPQHTNWGWRLVHYGNRFLKILSGEETRIDYAPNLLHQLVAELVQYDQLIADYYLNMQDARTIIIKR